MEGFTNQEKNNLILFTHGDRLWVDSLINKFENYENIVKFYRKLFGYKFCLTDGFDKIYLDFKAIYSYYQSKEIYIPKKTKTKYKFYIERSDFERIGLLIDGDLELTKSLILLYGTYDNVVKMIRNKIIYDLYI